MNKIKSLIKGMKDEKGVTTVEYAIMLVLVAIAVATAGTTLATAVTSVFTRMVGLLG